MDVAIVETALPQDCSYISNHHRSNPTFAETGQGPHTSGSADSGLPITDLMDPHIFDQAEARDLPADKTTIGGVTAMKAFCLLRKTSVSSICPHRFL